MILPCSDQSILNGIQPDFQRTKKAVPKAGWFHNSLYLA